MRDGDTLLDDPGPAHPPISQISYTNTINAALELADIGIPVFPVALSGTQKIPVITDWRHNASTDEGQIRAWFTGTGYLIGVPTGASSHYDVVDIDPRHGGGAWFAENEHRIPATCTHRTLRGGWHLLFRHVDGMRNSTSKIAPGADVRGEGGFVIHWPGHGLVCSTDPIAPWPDWLGGLAMAGRARRLTGSVPLDTRKPPSASHVAALLARLPNPIEVTRDTYVDVMLATKGCIDALIEAGELTDENFDNGEALIIDAAITWANRWEGGSENPTDEAAKWDADWAHRSAPLAGWQTLVKIADTLIPGYKEARIAEEFADPPPEVPGPPAYPGNPYWTSMLRQGKNGAVRANLLMNACIALRHAPEWQGVLAWNSFTKIAELRKPAPYCKGPFVPRPLTDLDVNATKVWLEQNYVDVSKDFVLNALRMVASEHSYHPVLDYLDGLTWDHAPRLDTWLSRLLGAEDTELNRAYSARFLISAVARVRDPGCKVDTVPVWESRQGLLKSTTLRVLSEPWFTDHLPDLASKDAQIQLLGLWLVEFPEYGQFGRADANRAKGFISIQQDRFRAPFDRVSEDHPRTCVLVVTLNPQVHGYLKDETGNRRFWPVALGIGWEPGRQIDIEALRRERDQLWAEADYRFKHGEKWWLHELPLLVAHETSVAARLDVGPWYGRVATAMQSLVEQGTPEPTFDQVCAAMGLMSAKDQTLQVYFQIGRALTAQGWTARPCVRNGVRQTYYLFVE